VVQFGKFNLWKNQQMGAFLHDTDHVVFSDSTLADNFWGIVLAQVQGVKLRGHRFVGNSAQMRSPNLCEWYNLGCGSQTAVPAHNHTRHCAP